MKEARSPKQGSKEIIVKDGLEERTSSFEKWVLGIYFLLLISLLLAFTFSKSLKAKILTSLEEIRVINLKWFIILLSMGVGLVIIGFPLSPWEMALGYVIKEFHLAFLQGYLAKLIGNSLIFFACKMCLREKILRMIGGNKFFRTLQKAAIKHPIKTVFLIKIMTIPHIIKNYGIGVLDIQYIHFIIPSVVLSAIFTSIWTYIGRQMSSVNELIQGEKEEKASVTIIKYVVIAMTIIFMLYAAYFGRKTYLEVESEIKAEEEEEARLKAEKSQDKEKIAMISSTYGAGEIESS